MSILACLFLFSNCKLPHARLSQHHVNAASSGRVQPGQWAEPCPTGVGAQTCAVGAAAPCAWQAGQVCVWSIPALFCLLCVDSSKHRGVSLFTCLLLLLSWCSRGLRLALEMKLMRFTTFTKRHSARVSGGFLSSEHHIWGLKRKHLLHLPTCWGLSTAADTGLPVWTQCRY